MRAVWPCEVVKPLPFVEFGFEIDVTFVTEKLIEFLLIRSVRALHFPVELWRSTFDVGVSNALVFNMPMEFGLELVAIVSSNFANTERKLLNDMINEVDRVCLRVFVVDLKCPDTCRIVDCGVLEPAHLLAAFPLKGQELDVYLDVVTWNLLLISLGVKLSHACAPGQSIEAVAPENAVNPSIRDLDVVIARQVPDDPDRPQVILAAQIQNLLDDLVRRLIGGVLRN